MRFDKTESAHTDKKIKEAATGLRYGRITKVYEHTEATDGSNFEVDVVTHDREKHYRRVPVIVNSPGEVSPPRVDDAGLLGFLDGDHNAPVLLGIMYTVENRPPTGEAGDFKLVRGNLSLELDGAGEAARLAQTDEGADTPSVRIEIDDTGDAPVVTVKGDDPEMGLELDMGTGEFKLGDGAGYGIVSDGNGNFTWYENSVDFVDDGSTINW